MVQAVAAIAVVASTAFTAIEARNQAKFQEKTQKLQAKLADTRAIQRDVQRREELDRTVGAIRAARASAGTGINSPTGRAFVDEANQVISTQRLREVASERQNAANFRAAARNSRGAARNALIGGAIKTAGSLFTGINSGAFDRKKP